jgi:hypothetical protein
MEPHANTHRIGGTGIRKSGKTQQFRVLIFSGLFIKSDEIKLADQYD